MAKGCLTKMTTNVLANCNIPAHGIKDLYLMHVEDVTFVYTPDGSQISDVTFAEGAKSYRIEGYKQNLQITATLRSLDPSGRFDVSVMFKTHAAPGLSRALMYGRFYVLVVPPITSSLATVWGCSSPLECSNVEFDSNANGRRFTYTLTAPEGSAGNNMVIPYGAAMDSIISKSV